MGNVRLQDLDLSIPQEIIEKGIAIIQKYNWLLDSYVLDYYTDSHWEKIPQDWLKTLTDIDLAELAQFVDVHSTAKFSRVWPLSLITLRVLVAHLSIPRHTLQLHSASETWLNICCDMTASKLSELRQQIDDHATNKQFEKISIEEFNFISKSVYKEDSSASYRQDSSNDFLDSGDEHLCTTKLKTLPYLTHTKLKNVFNKHVNPKKRHEISQFAKVTAETAQKSGCNFVLDVGSGRGHLARLLAYGYGLKVCCLEAQTALVHEAKKFDLELEQTGSKHLKPEDIIQCYRPVHLNLKLTHDTKPQEVFEGLKTAYGKLFDANACFGIVGLHPCGDLAPILLRLFIDCPNATFINLVGCCFMKLTSTSSSPHLLGYPMSNFLLARQELYDLSYLLRELACHALETYCERLQAGNYQDLKVHCYRATLEEIIVKNWPHFRHSAIKSVKYRNEMTFSEYCDAALSKLPINVPLKDKMSNKTIKNILEWKQVVIFYTMRLFLGPLIETVILVDRLLYLREHGINSILAPVFDPKLSPRNHVLIGIKCTQQ